jgi:hypothetical protein
MSVARLERWTPSKWYRILSLDGGGAKGFYTLGVLKQIEALLGGGPLGDRFIPYGPHYISTEPL